MRVLLIGFLLLGLWQSIISFTSLPNYILPSPFEVGLSFVQNWSILLKHFIPTFNEILLGFLLGIIFGCLFGLILKYFTRLADWFLPVLIISQAVPTFAIAPLLVIWFGYGFVSKIITIILMIFFPIASTFYDGLRNTPTGWLDLARTMNGSKWRIFLTIQIPAALPSLASGIRISAVLAPIGSIIGEWVGASEGLGYLIINANARMQIDLMFATLLIIIFISLILYFSVDKILRVTLWWSK
jgi:putative hydroxymethylpyrimidine transport system permease protein